MVELELPWTEKYRPKKLEGVVGQDVITERLKAYVKEREMPNMLFAGRPGIGKTCCALALAHEIYGPNISRNFLEMNASDERGIDVVRGKIKDFAAVLPFGEVGFKIIFLDEADALTPDAQNALRRTMERFTGTCRFILSCNYSNKIIEPIQSRCAVFRFKSLADKDIKEMLSGLVKEEKLKIDEKAYEAIIYVSEGDMRKAINTLQISSTLNKTITPDIVFSMAARAKPEEVGKMLKAAMGGKFLEARKYLDVLLYDQGVSGDSVLNQIYREIISMQGIDERKKVSIADKIGEIDFRMTEGANERIQLEALLAALALI